MSFSVRCLRLSSYYVISGGLPLHFLRCDIAAHLALNTSAATDIGVLVFDGGTRAMKNARRPPSPPPPPRATILLIETA